MYSASILKNKTTFNRNRFSISAVVFQLFKFSSPIQYFFAICNDECVKMNVYMAKCVTELGSNNSEPEAREASVGRTYASAHKQLIGGTADGT